MSKQPTMTRQDIAVETGLSIRRLKRRERALGLLRCRVKLGSESVVYSRAKVEALPFWQQIFSSPGR